MTTTNRTRRRRASKAGAGLICGLATVLMVSFAGCGGANLNSKATTGPTTGLPAPAAAAKFNTYAGSQGTQNIAFAASTVQGGLLKTTIDDSLDKFTLLNTTFGFAASDAPGILGGSFVADGGFLNLTTVNLGAALPFPTNVNPGYGIEIPGRALLLRPGDFTVPPAFLVPVSSSAAPVCQAINGTVTFQFVTLPGPFNSIVADPLYNASTAGPAYGIVNASAKGGNYSFSSFNEFYLDGMSTGPAPLQPGLCAQTLAGAGITIPADQAHNVPPSTIEIGPTGFFVLDQTVYPNSTPASAPAEIGVIRPSSALDVGSVAGARYLGLRFEPAAEGLGISITEPTAFGVVAGTSGTLVGGIFPNDDPTQTALSDTTITFGPQAADNGIFQQASVTLPDPFSVCVGNPQGVAGMDGSGNPTCTFPAAIVAGNPEGKFALFLVANNPVDSSPMGIYLFQQ